MFDKRIEPRYDTEMRNSDIETAREIAADMKKLAETARDMHNFNHLNIIRVAPNLSRAARNIIRLHSLIQDAHYEMESLQEAYIAQYSYFDNNGEIVKVRPNFDESKQAIAEDFAVKMWNNARGLLIRSILTFAKKLGFYPDYWTLFVSDRALEKAIREHIAPAITQNS